MVYKALLAKTVANKLEGALDRQIAFLGANNNQKPAFKQAPVAPRNNNI